MTYSFETLINDFKRQGPVYSRPEAPRSDSEKIKQALSEPGCWHNNIRDAVASMVAKGEPDKAILANATAWTLQGYTVDQTHDELQVFIDGARAKGYDKGLKRFTNQTEWPELQQTDSAQVASINGSKGCDQFFSAATLKTKAVPRRRWLVDGLLPQKTVTLLSGDGGTGKSLLALQLAVAVVTNSSWIGRAVASGRVIYMSAEDDAEELHRRIDDILTPEMVDYDELEGLTLRSLVGELALLADDEQGKLAANKLYNELDARAKAESPALIVIDTLADVFPGNENDRSKVVQFVGLLRGLAIRHNCAVLLLAHPSLTGLANKSGTSGSTAWNNSVRSRLYLNRITANGEEPNPDARTLTTMKSNYARTGDEISLGWVEGRFVVRAAPTGLDAMAAREKAKRVFLTLLRRVNEQGRRVNAHGSSSYAPKVFSELPDSEGLTKRELGYAMAELLDEKRIRIIEVGSKSRRTTYLEVV